MAVLAWNPQAEFRTRADFAAANIDASIRYVKTWGCVIPELGGAKYRKLAAPPTDTTNMGYVQSADGAWWTLTYDDQAVNIAMFGAQPGDTPPAGILTTNNKAFVDAHNWCDSQITSKYVPLFFPSQSWRKSQSIPLKEGMVWRGEGGMVDDFFHGPAILDGASTMFDIPSTLEGCSFEGLGFDGRGRRFDFLPDTRLDTSKVLQWSCFYKCAWKNFNAIFRGYYTRLQVLDCWTNSVNQSFYLKGADCTLDNCNVGGQGTTYIDPATGASSPARATDFVMVCEFLGTSRIGRMFVTGRPMMPLQLRGNLKNTIIHDFWADIADYCGIHCEGAYGFQIDRTTVNKCQFKSVTAPHATYKGLIQLNNSHDYTIGKITYAHSENTNPGPPPTVPPPTLYITSTADGNAYNAYVDEAVYQDGHVRNVFVGTNADYPRFATPLGALVVSTATNTNGLSADLRTVVLNAPIAAARTFFLNSTRAKAGDRRRFVRLAGATGGFFWNIANGLAGPTIAQLTAGQTYEAEFDGTNWF